MGRLELDDFRLLRGVRMCIARVALELLEQRVAERALWQHAFYGVLEDSIRILGVHLVECGLVNTAGEARVAEIRFLRGLITGHTQFVDVRDNHEIASVHVWGVDRLVFAAKTNRDLAGQTAEHLIGAIYQEPLLGDVRRFGGKGFHVDLDSFDVVQSVVSWGFPRRLCHRKRYEFFPAPKLNNFSEASEYTVKSVLAPKIWAVTDGFWSGFSSRMSGSAAHAATSNCINVRGQGTHPGQRRVARVRQKEKRREPKKVSPLKDALPKEEEGQAPIVRQGGGVRR